MKSLPEPTLDILKNNIEIKNECHEWKGVVSTDGYPLYGQHRVHRLIYEMIYGEIPNGLFICHKCNNKKCININHLYAGSPSDNQKDKGRKYKKKRDDSDELILEENKINKSFMIFRLDSELHQSFKMQALKERKSMQGLIEELIKEYLERKK